MNHNNISLISLAIVTIVGLILGYTITLFLNDVVPIVKDGIRFAVVVLIMTTFYAPLKVYLLKKILKDEGK